MSDFRASSEKGERDNAPANRTASSEAGEEATQARTSRWIIQAKFGSAGGASTGADVEASAARGVAAPGGGLPHGDAIQRSFGKHAVGGVSAHVGGEAAEAAGELGAKAYATGNDVAFAEAPDLHTAAHEAAHVVQQRQGVQLESKLGTPGDVYEQHADRVADAVVSGTSAEGLLNRSPGTSGTAGSAIQRRSSKKKPKKTEEQKRAEGLTEDGSIAVMRAASDILKNRNRRLISQAPASYVAALDLLYMAAVGTSRSAKAKTTPVERKSWLDTSARMLEPVAKGMVAINPENQAWLDTHYRPHLTRLRNEIAFASAKARVDSAFITGEGTVLEIPDDSDAHGQAVTLKHVIHKQIQTLGLFNEQALRLGHAKIHHLAHNLSKGQVPPGGKQWGSLSLLVELQSLLLLADGWLTLTDKELPKHLAEVHGILPGIQSYAELVKGVTELVGGTVSVTATFGWAIAKCYKDVNAAATAAGVAQTTGLILANAVAAVEIVYGLAVLFDSTSSPEDKDNALRSVGVGAAWFIGKKIGQHTATSAATAAGGEAAAEFVASRAATMGGAASIAVLITYYELKLMASLYGQARFGLASMMTHALRRMQSHGQSIASDADSLAKASILMHEEKDPEAQKNLGRVQKLYANQLSRSLDSFLSDCVKRGYQAGGAYYPGSWQVLVDEFDEFQSLRGTKEPEGVAKLATAVLGKIQWCFKNADYLVAKTAGKKLKHPSYGKSQAAGGGEDGHH